MFRLPFINKKTQQEKRVELYIQDMKLYLENNYKDLAIKSRKDGVKYLEEVYSKGEIKEKPYLFYKAILDEYTEMMKDYNHQKFYRS